MNREKGKVYLESSKDTFLKLIFLIIENLEESNSKKRIQLHLFEINKTRESLLWIEKLFQIKRILSYSD